MDNNNMNVSAVFFRQGKSYYFKYKDGVCGEIKSFTMNKLKQCLNFPFKVAFVGMSRAQIEKVIADLLDSTVEVSIRKINNENDNLLRFEATFIQQKKFVEVYKVPNESCLYGRKPNCNPFLYTEFNNKKVLIETTKKDAKNNVGTYYFIANDLGEEDQIGFCGFYTKLECDYIYRIENSLNYNNHKILTRKVKDKF